MKDSLPLTSTLKFAALCLAIGCGDSESKKAEKEGGEPGCELPTAEAGRALNAPIGSSITLNGNGSTWCEDYAAY